MKKYRKKNDKIFEKQAKIHYYLWGLEGHVRTNCPDNPNRRNPVHYLKAEEVLDAGFKSYLGKIRINGKERAFLRDSGSFLDVIESNMVSVDNLLFEKYG